MSDRGYKLFSLFSGAGGMDLGFKLSGKFQMLLANDILLPSAQTYASNFRHQIIDISEAPSFKTHAPVYFIGDISKIDFEAIEQDGLDLLVGGPPCQDFSVVRGPEKERQGISVKRGRLYAHFVRALIHLQPKVFVFENVPGLKSANKATAYKTIIEDFSKLKLSWGKIKKLTGNTFSDNVRNYLIIFSNIVDSANLGVPQRRRRLIIIGVREDFITKKSITEINLKKHAESILTGKNSIFTKYPLTPLEVFEGLTLPQLADDYKEIMEEYSDVKELIKTERALQWRNDIWKNLTFDVIKDYFKINNITPRDNHECDEAFDQHAEVLKKLGYYKNKLEAKKFSDNSNAKSKESREVLERMKIVPPDENHVFVRGSRCEVQGKGMSLIYRRLHPLKPSYTVVAYGGGGTWGYHYRRCRGKLTNRERARLQTFPDWFSFKGTTSEVRAQIGEAVPFLLGESVAEIVEMILKSGRKWSITP